MKNLTPDTVMTIIFAMVAFMAGADYFNDSYILGNSGTNYNNFLYLKFLGWVILTSVQGKGKL